MSDPTTTHPVPDPTTTHPVPEPTRYREAYEQLLPEFQLVPDDKLLSVNIDIGVAVTTALGSLGRIQAYRPQLDALPLDRAKLDKLVLYTRALGHAHSRHLLASTPSSALPKMFEEAQALRELLVSDTSALAKRGIVPSEPLKELRGSVGYRNTGFDLLAVAGLLREAWATVSSKSAIQLADLDRAEVLGEGLLAAVGERDQLPAAVSETALRRQQAFTLFWRAYQETQRGLAFLRWYEEDADSIAPPLNPGRRGRKKPEPAADEAPSQPHLEPAAAFPSAPVPPGHPGGSPFTE